MSVTIALFNTSGGVGKTTVTQNIGFHLAHDFSFNILLVDMDPQASLTTFLGLVPFDLKQTVYESLLYEQPLPIVSDAEIKDVICCDVVPSNIKLAQAELQLASELRREYKLTDILSAVSKNYDFILIDCPPSLGLLSINCLVAADYLCIPIQTEYKSLEATINLLQTTVELAQKVNQTLKVIGVIPTMYDRNTLAQQALETIEEVFGNLRKTPSFAETTVFPPIPRRIDFAKASANHLPLAKFTPSHPALEQLKAVASTLGKLK